MNTEPRIHTSIELFPSSVFSPGEEAREAFAELSRGVVVGIGPEDAE